MKRRGFLKALGLSPVVGPVAAKQAMADLSLQGVSGNYQSGAVAASNTMGVIGGGPNWAQRLAKFNALTTERKEWMRKQVYVEGLDPGVASLRSVALHKKISMTRDIAFAQSQARELDRLKRGVLGWFDDDGDYY